MQAQLMGFPLLKPDAMEREIQSVHQEFEGNFPYDSVRTELLLNQCVNDKTNPCSKFSWGNLESLAGKNKDTLYDDLQIFFAEQYSADRMSVAV